MSKILSAVAQQQFDSEVKHAYQGMSALRGTTRIRTGVVADVYKFRTMGKGIAQQRTASQDDVTPMDVTHALVNCTLTNWVAPEYTDIFDQAQVNFEERAELVKAVAGAIGRRFDQLIIDALVASSATKIVAEDFGTTDSSLTVPKLRRAKSLLDQDDVPNDGRTILVNAKAMEGLLGETQATSADFASVKALVQGEVNSFMGFNFIRIGDRNGTGEEGGLPTVSTYRRCWAWHRDAMGVAIGIDPNTSIDWVPEKVSWLVNGILRAGSVAIDNEGIVEVQTFE